VFESKSWFIELFVSLFVNAAGGGLSSIKDSNLRLVQRKRGVIPKFRPIERKLFS
jgi:hypothetical protein